MQIFATLKVAIMARRYICVALLHILLGLTKAGCSDLFTIEGKVIPPEPKPSDWHWTTTILIDGGVVKTAFIKVTHTYVSFTYLLSKHLDSIVGQKVIILFEMPTIILLQRNYGLDLISCI